jgi:hypothetical protein
MPSLPPSYIIRTQPCLFLFLALSLQQERDTRIEKVWEMEEKDREKERWWEQKHDLQVQWVTI